MNVVTIVDYGMGNIGSLRNMFRRAGVDTVVASDRTSIAQASKLLLPGVGAFDAAMQRMDELRLIDPLRAAALSGTPILGICLGMQLLTSSSEEGLLPGLGLIKGRARRFPRKAGLKVPHMGWNIVRTKQPNAITRWMREETETRFYFVHSYAVEIENPAHEILSCEYGIPFAAGIADQNVFGTQFHPEKSHRFGLQLLSAFADLRC